MFAVSVYVGFCAYLMTAPKHRHLWHASGFICIVIAADASGSTKASEIPVERTQETGMGILVYTVITALLWPRSSRGTREESSRRLFAVQDQLYRALMRGEGRSEDTRQAETQQLQLLKQAEPLLNAAEYKRLYPEKAWPAPDSDRDTGRHPVLLCAGRLRRQ